MKWILSLGIITALVLQVRLLADDAPEYRFLMERVSIPTDTGIVAIPAGTRVVIVSEKKGKSTVKAGQRQFEVETIQLSKDSEAAQKILDKEAAAQKERSKEQRKDAEDAAIAHPSGATPGDKLRSLEKQAIVVHTEMEQIFTEMMQTPHKVKPRTPDEYANNEKHDALKKRHAELKTQYNKIMEAERLLRHDTR